MLRHRLRNLTHLISDSVGLGKLKNMHLEQVPSVFVSSLCAQHTLRPNYTQMSEVGAEKGFLTRPFKIWVAHSLKILKSLKAFSKAFFFFFPDWLKFLLSCCFLFYIMVFIFFSIIASLQCSVNFLL